MSKATQSLQSNISIMH